MLDSAARREPWRWVLTEESRLTWRVNFEKDLGEVKAADGSCDTEDGGSGN